jgi:hypothetical protein
MAGTEASAPDHHGSHNELLWLPDSTSSNRTSLDAIIVPTVRRPSFLADAADLAAVLGVTLVTLHSGKFTTAEKARRVLPAKVDLLAVDVPREGRLRLPRWRTTCLLEGTAFARRSDLSAKRNFSLLLSRMQGWQRVLYLDDDITGLKPNDIGLASGMLDVHNAVGLKIGGFPDHSVVCHAYRGSGGNQQAFIGGGAMAVQTGRNTSFFPDIYNDDWFFLLDGKRGLQSVAAAGEVTQEAYDPFCTPERARGEELGDVLAEGLYWLLDQGRSVADADREHWEAFLAKRKLFIERVITMVEGSDLGATEVKRRTAALNGSLDSLSLISATLCELYLRAWADDGERWQEHLDKLPTAMSRRQAVNWLTRNDTPRQAALHPVRPDTRSSQEHPAPSSPAVGHKTSRLLPVAALLSMLVTASAAGLVAVGAASRSHGRRLWSAAGRERGRIGRLRWPARR